VEPDILVKRIASIACFVLVVAACGDTGMMDGLGLRSHDYVEGSTTSTRFTADTAPVTAVSDVIEVENVGWFNQAIEGETIGEPGAVIAAVWARGTDEGRFIQASPAEIDIALPGVEFPSLVPESADWITSQLVYDAASATLDIEVSAAFGLWSVLPYTDDEGRLAVLRVGQATAASEVGSGITSSAVEDGLNLMWSSGLYRYELFCRSQVVEAQCWQMVESTVPLSLLAPAAVSDEG
jgi:hypothetical protein